MSNRIEVNRSRYHDGQVRVSRINGNGVAKLYVGVLPDTADSFAAQIKDAYVRLDDVLEREGARRQDVITERVFFSDIQTQYAVLQDCREDFYGDGGSAVRPVTSYLQQPPCRLGSLCELQVRVVFAAKPGQDLQVRDLQVDLGAGAGKVVSYGGDDHVYLHHITGGEGGDDLDYAAQAEQLFDRAEIALETEGLTFRDVVRTWLYIDEMERDYDDLNRVRTAFFKRVGVDRLPASTGIQGGVYPCDRGGTMDLYALRARGPIAIDTMHAKTLNEAPVYGSAFSRGLVVTHHDRHIAYISGTASIDEQGDVVCIGDFEGQVHRMLQNVEGLLEGSGASMHDIVRATTYLKDPNNLASFLRIWRDKDLPRDIPHTICHADVCRPDWLVEIEAVAVFPPVA